MCDAMLEVKSRAGKFEHVYKKVKPNYVIKCCICKYIIVFQQHLSAGSNLRTDLKS